MVLDPTIWITVGQGPSTLVVGAGEGCLDIFNLIYPVFPLSPSLWEMALYRLKYCIKGSLTPKPTNQLKSGVLKTYKPSADVSQKPLSLQLKCAKNLLSLQFSSGYPL